ncbi:uncharacterized protein P174DRAFT_53819 [Aspergillus novofumigatus IBT 16806]|uniref:FAD-binding domain-containing protein n=1 Tax=Aspergillus novofumigatus (strain IBT 16806) TaxID=1392255 RepID=A0A2I1CPZ5_ASPN1|nr:uncharacterized protein P174DRAFT_53819 [Aspergillus novofumigatus IBT 16806]PKX99685.1 hypothetical protein P174DRAFT_53819 [Aspergillus novofumigatus IBT 16806]
MSRNSQTRWRFCLADGTVETGDMVLSCDGVHSLMRSFMWDQQASTVPPRPSACTLRTTPVIHFNPRPQPCELGNLASYLIDVRSAGGRHGRDHVFEGAKHPAGHQKYWP